MLGVGVKGKAKASGLLDRSESIAANRNEECAGIGRFGWNQQSSLSF